MRVTHERLEPRRFGPQHRASERHQAVVATPLVFLAGRPSGIRDPKSIELKPGFTRDVTEIGHYGTGDLEIVIDSAEDFEAAKPLFVKSYDVS